MFGKNTTTGDRKTAFSVSGRKTPTDDRKTPPGGKKITFGDRKTPTDDSTEKIQKRSMLDMFSASSKEAPKPKSRDSKTKKKSLLAESDSDSDMGMGTTRNTQSPSAKQRRGSDREFNRSPALRKMGRDTPDDDDEVDGFRGPSRRNKPRERDSPQQFGGPSLKNRSGSPQERSGGNSSWGDMQKPSLRNRRPESDEDDDDIRNRRGRQDRRQYRDDYDDERVTCYYLIYSYNKSKE